MMAIVSPVITVYVDVDANDGTYFTVEDDTLGLLDTGGVLAGDIAVEFTGYGYSVNINRGRARELDEITAGTCRIGFRNDDRSFDTSYASGQFYEQLVPGKRVQVSIYGVTIFDGSAEDWSDSYDPYRNTDASVLAVDALGLLARKDLSAFTATSQAAGARIDAVLARDEVLYPGGADLDAGIDTLQADEVSAGTNALNYLQTVAMSDSGRLFASRSGVLTFRDRLSVDTSTSRMTFADDGSGYAFVGVQKRTSSELLYTRVSAERTGGTAQVSSDSTAITSYGVRTLSLTGLLLNDDTQVGDLADYLLGIYKTPEDRLAAVVVNVSRFDSQADQATIASLEIGDVIEVTWTPNRVGSARTDTVIVEGVAHQIAVSGAHVLTLSVSAVSTTSPFIIEDDLLGLLDTGGVLSY